MKQYHIIKAVYTSLINTSHSINKTIIHFIPPLELKGKPYIVFNTTVTLADRSSKFCLVGLQLNLLVPSAYFKSDLL